MSTTLYCDARSPHNLRSARVSGSEGQSGQQETLQRLCIGVDSNAHDEDSLYIAWAICATTIAFTLIAVSLVDVVREQFPFSDSTLVAYISATLPMQLDDQLIYSMSMGSPTLAKVRCYPI